MINKMMKINFVLVVIVLMGLSANAQSKYGTDSVACIENLSLFREYYKQKNYVDALKPWRWTFNNCPKSSGNIYKNGPKIYKERIKVDKENKAAYIDTIMMIFDQRIQYFGKEGYVLGLKGYELVIADKKRSAEALSILDKSITLDGNNADFRAVYGYMKAIVNLEKNGEKTKQDVLEAYARISEVIDYNIVNESKVTKYFIQYAEKIENLFTPYANCEDLVTLFSAKFDPATEDVSFLKRVTKVLEKKECTNEQLFFDASSRLYELDPSASSADKMAKMSIAKGKYSDAIEFAAKAIEMEEVGNQKAIYYLGLADAYRNAGSFLLARNAVYSALELRSGWGEAYLNLGNIYISGAKNCGGDFEKSTVYWVAIDAFSRALSDEDTKARASKSINTYSKYFPTKETCFFNGVEAGKSHTIGCWINKATTARTSD
jgi:tetratricopeptide (TPR) repeat protein